MPAAADPPSTLEVDGAVVLRYDRVAGEPPLAANAVPLGPLDVVAAAARRHRRGWLLRSQDERFIEALLAAGATLLRRAHRYRRALDGSGATPPGRGAVDGVTTGVAVTPLDATPGELAALAARAYPPGHPDHHDATGAHAVEDFAALLDGTHVGPHLAVAGTQVRDGGRLVGACIINRNGPAAVAAASPAAGPRRGEPWVSDVFRDPDPRYRGVGSALLEASMAELARRGETVLGLVVTDGNPARARYEALGFTLVESHATVAL